MSLCDHTFGLLDHLPDYCQIVERFMNTSGHKTNTLSDFPFGILLRRTTQILLQTLQIPLELGQRDQSRLCRPLMRLHRISAQDHFALQKRRENSNNSIAQPESEETGDVPPKINMSASVLRSCLSEQSLNFW